jgi:A/G-specific adenine glycosylase
LKGVGDYTAAAIASIAFQLPYPAVDGNVLRVILPIFWHF